MSDQKLRVLARGTALVPKYEAQANRLNSFVGWSCQAIGPEFVDPETRQPRRHAGFVKRVGEVVELPVRAEYLRHLRDRDLWPADEATAQIACVPFDPKYGGEHDDKAKAARDSEVASLTKPAPSAAKGA